MLRERRSFARRNAPSDERSMTGAVLLALGLLGSAAALGPAAAPPPKVAGSGTKPLFTYATPIGWQRTQGGRSLVARFAIPDGLRAAEVQIAVLPKPERTPLEYVDRLRGVFGLGPADVAAVKGSARSLPVDGIKGIFLDLSDPEGKTTPKIGLFAVLVPQKTRLCVFVLHGPSDLAGKNRRGFEKFVRSVSLEAPQVDRKRIARLEAVGAEYELDGRGSVAIVTLMGRKKVPADIEVIGELVDLEELWLDGSPVGDATVARVKNLARLRRLGLNKTNVTDAGLKSLERLADLEAVGLTGTRVTDKGLAHLAGLKSLIGLDLSGTTVTDKGLARLAGLTKLRSLGLDGTKVGDAGLSQLRRMRELEELNLDDTSVTDAGLAHLRGLTRLTQLRLMGTRITDEGLAHLTKLANLQILLLARTKIADGGIRHLEGLADVAILDLSGTGITDAALDRLAGMKRLTHLVVRDTKVTEAGVRKLRLALPSTRVVRTESDSDD